MNRRSFIQSASAFFAGLCFWKPKANAEEADLVKAFDDMIEQIEFVDPEPYELATPTAERKA